MYVHLRLDIFIRNRLYTIHEQCASDLHNIFEKIIEIIEKGKSKLWKDCGLDVEQMWVAETRTIMSGTYVGGTDPST